MKICEAISMSSSRPVCIVTTIGVIVAVALAAIGQTVCKGQMAGVVMSYAGAGLGGLSFLGIAVYFLIKRVERQREKALEEEEWAGFPFKDSAEMAKEIIDGAHILLSMKEEPNFEAARAVARRQEVRRTLGVVDHKEADVANIEAIRETHSDELTRWLEQGPASRQTIFSAAGNIVQNRFNERIDQERRLLLEEGRTWEEVLQDRVGWAQNKCTEIAQEAMRMRLGAPPG